MKRILLLITATLLLTLGVNSQVTGFTNTLDYSQTYIYEFDLDGVFSTGDSIWTYSVFKNSDSYLRPTLYIETDSISGTQGQVKFYLESKEWDEQSYTLRDSVTWVTGVDTSFSITVSTAIANTIWQTRAVGANDEFRFNIDVFKIKFYK